LNEILADNKETKADQNGEYDSWVEIFNNSDADRSLWGFSLTDDPALPAKWSLPDTIVSSGKELTIWLDNQTNQAGLHASFTIPKDGGSLYFCAPNKTNLDSISYPETGSDIS